MNLKQYKKFWFNLIRWVVVFAAGYYIYNHVFDNRRLAFDDFIKLLKNNILQNNIALVSVLLMSLVNWFFEIIKWKLLTKNVKLLSLLETAEQCLTSHTFSLITPFKSGEYAGKAFFYKKTARKKIVLLNFIGNAYQLFATLFFGIIGLFFIIKIYHIEVHFFKIRRFIYILFGIIVLILGKKNLYHKKESFYHRALLFYKKIPVNTKFNVMVLSLLRYLIFSHQFYFLLYFFHADIPYYNAMILISGMYLTATLLPVINLFDFVVKGSIAVYLFAFESIVPIKIFAISLLMWILNFALPASAGAFFILFNKKSDKK